MLAVVFTLSAAYTPAAPLRLVRSRAAVGMAAVETFKPNMMKPNLAVEVYADADGISAAVVDIVKAESAKAIAAKGSFSMAIPSGSMVKALTGLSAGDCEFDKFHVFFVNDFKGGEYVSHPQCVADFSGPCGIPESQVYKHAEMGPAGAAAYLKTLVDCPATAVETPSSRSSPGFIGGAVDLILLGTGDDGHCGFIFPGSPELAKTGSGELVLAAEGGTVTMSMDLINAAGKVVLGAATAGRAEMVKKALKEGKNSGMPTGNVAAKDTVWLTDTDSIAAYKAA
jgi:6-phosphogluconolactonase